MSQMQDPTLGMPGSGKKRSAPMDIYTVLTLIALLSLIVGISFICVRSKALFGVPNPFAIVSNS